MNAPAMIGHNASPYEQAKGLVDDALLEARAWLDGAAIADAEQADGLAGVLDMVRKAKKAADEARKAEAKPFDDGKAEVQARYKPLLTDAERAEDACKAALARWQRVQQEAKEAEARAAREAAAAAQREAEQARRAADAVNLAEREAAEAKLAEAERLARAADKIEAAPVGAKGVYAAKRLALIVTQHPVAIHHGNDALRFIRERWPNDLKAALIEIVRQHKAEGVPGVTYETRETVR